MRWLFFLTAPLWGFAFFIWCRSGFGLHPIIRVTSGEAFGLTLVVTAPFWLLAAAGARHTAESAWLRLIGLPLAGWPFVMAPFFILEMVILPPPYQHGWWLAANLVLFRLPFVLVVICLVLQCALMVQDIRAKAYLPPPHWWSAFGVREARRRLPYGGYW